MPTTTLRRCLAGVAAAGALVATAAAPALAVEDPRLAVYFPDTTIAAGGPGMVSAPILYAIPGSHVLEGVTVHYEFHDLAGVVEVAEDSPVGFCTAPTAGELHCALPWELDLDEHGTVGTFGLLLTATAEAAIGAEGQLRVTFAADGFDPVSHSARIRVGEAVDLATDGESTEVSAAPGAAFTAPLTVRNAGETTIQGAHAVFFNDYAIRATERFSNCTYTGDQLRSCRFDQPLAAGHGYTAELPYTLRADTWAPGHEYGEISWMTGAEFEDYVAYLTSQGADLGEPGDGGVLTLAEVEGFQAQDAQADTDPYNNSASVIVVVTGENRADLAALGDTVAGAAGELVTVTPGLVNEGPAVVDQRRSGSPVTNIRVTVPTGTTAVAVPDNCVPVDGDGGPNGDLAGEPGARTYQCYSTPFIAVHERQTLEFTLRIDEVIADAAGSVEINIECQCEGMQDDLDDSNDLAQILVNPSDGSGGAGGGAGGDSLPITGARTGSVVGVGLLLLAAGVLSRVLARRRPGDLVG